MKKWTIEDDILLYKLQPFFTVKDIAKRLGVNPDSVRIRIKLLGLRKYEGEMPMQYFIYKMLKIYKDNADNRLTLANGLGIDLVSLTNSYNQMKRRVNSETSRL